jgi:hypothetical protein
VEALLEQFEEAGLCGHGLATACGAGELRGLLVEESLVHGRSDGCTRLSSGLRLSSARTFRAPFGSVRSGTQAGSPTPEPGGSTGDVGDPVHARASRSGGGGAAGLGKRAFSMGLNGGARLPSPKWMLLSHVDTLPPHPSTMEA